ncbi:hypothetical protein Lser_V15G37319 [Lactuca serriola]
MNKENSGVGQLSNEQKARISANFRAAKALLDRKCPRDASMASNSFPRKIRVLKAVETPSIVSSVNRLPLADISMNTPTLVRDLKLNQSGCLSSSCFKVPSVGKNDGGLFAMTRVLPDENEKAHTSFQTLIRQILSNIVKHLFGIKCKELQRGPCVH